MSFELKKKIKTHRVYNSLKLLQLITRKTQWFNLQQQPENSENDHLQPIIVMTFFKYVCF